MQTCSLKHINLQILNINDVCSLAKGIRTTERHTYHQKAYVPPKGIRTTKRHMYHQKAYVPPKINVPPKKYTYHETNIHSQNPRSPLARCIISMGRPQNGGCRCGKSRCLKLYCNCFSSAELCGIDCVCEECGNTTENAKERDLCVRTTRLNTQQVCM